jgi:hypothetical protein
MIRERLRKKRKQSAMLLALVVSFFSCTAKTGGASGKPAESGLQPQAVSAQPASLLVGGTPNGPGKWAVLIGINNYRYSDRISTLAGSLNDVEEMRQLLIGKFEFPPENILTLTDSQATHAAIIDAIQTHLIAKAQPGDIALIHYSGHGSQMKDVTGKMISGLDETIVPYDSRDLAGKVFDISGAELHPLLLQLAKKTKNLTFILDSCHSGTLVRGARVRTVAADTRTPPPLPAYTVAATRELGAVNEETSPKFAAIAAATSRESAFEHFADGKDHGALTYFLVRQLRGAKAGVTYRDIMDNVAGDVTANYPNQHVSLEGAEADQYVFGDGSSLARAYVTASPSLLTPHRVTLSVGQVQGATVGSAYDIYAPGSKRLGPPEKPVARIRVASVGALSSEATFISGSSIAQASRAVEREHQYGKLRMRVFLDGVDGSPTLQSIKTALQAVMNVELVDAPSACNMQLKESGKRIQTLAADSTTLSTPVAASDPNAVDRVVDQVKSWAKWFNVLSIRNPHSDIELQFTISGSQTRDPMARVGKPDMGVWDNEKIDATLTNNGQRDVYIAILDLSSDGSVSVVYPAEQGAAEVLKSSQKLTRSFTTFVPKGRSVVTDILKVFASYKPIDLRPLTQGAIRDIGEQETDDPLQGLLSDSSGGTRGISPVLTKPADLSTFAIAQRVVVVKKRK